MRSGNEQGNEDERNPAYSFDFSRFYKVQRLHLFDNRAYKLYFSSSEGLGPSFFYL